MTPKQMIINQSTLLLALLLAPMIASADEPAFDIYAKASSDKPLASAPTHAPKLSRQDNATLHLGIIREQTENVETTGFFGAIFASDDPINATLLQDLDIFTTIYQDLPIAAEGMHLRGQIYKKIDQPEAALVSWLQTIAEFPKSSAARKAQADIELSLAGDLKHFYEVMNGIIANFPAGNAPTRLNYLINKLYPLENIKLSQALTQLQVSFLKRFADDAHADEVQVLLAHNQGAASAEGGIFGFKKVLALYPNSSYRPEAMLAIADLQRLRLKAYEKASSNYRILIAEFPNHELSKLAYQNLALTLNEHLRDYPEAIVVLGDIVKKYPKDKAALEALQTMARLQAKKTDQPREAVTTLRKLAMMFKGYEATDALSDAIKISERTLKDDALTLSLREQIVRDFPTSNEAPIALFDMAEYADKTEKNQEKAKVLYGQLVQAYPEHKLAAEAKKRL